MNPYTFNIPTEIILYLCNIIKMYNNPIACKSVDNIDYVVLDMKSFNPFLKDKRKRFLLYFLENNQVFPSNIPFYYVNFGYNDTLISLEPAINKLLAVTQTERFQSFFSYQNNLNKYYFNVFSINQLKNYKIAISNCINLPGPLYVINNDFLIVFISFYDPIQKFFNTVFSITAYYNNQTNQWDSTRIKYNILNGTCVGLIDGKPIFSINFKQVMMFNNVYFLPYDNGSDNILIGGDVNYNYRMESKRIANICQINELQVQNDMNGNDLIQYIPLNKYYFLLCLPQFEGTYYYLLGFTGANSPGNFYSILQSAKFSELFLTMFYSIIKSEFTIEKLPETPIIDYEGLIIWFDFQNTLLIIYQPTFDEFVHNHTMYEFGVQDLLY